MTAAVSKSKLERVGKLLVNFAVTMRRDPRRLAREVERVLERMSPSHLAPKQFTTVSAGENLTSALRKLPPSAEFYDIMPMCAPLSFEIDPQLADRPAINVLIPGVRMEAMSGGPNTAFSLTYRLANLGIPVRYLSVNAPPDEDHEPIFSHLMGLSGVNRSLENVEIVDANDRSQCFSLGKNDLFFATAWWTAQMVKQAIPRFENEKFIYLIQDFEPGLHEYSSYYALAMDSYNLDFLPLINHPILAEHFIDQKIGHFSNADFAMNTAIIDPAIDRTNFYPEKRPERKKKRLLFYARPTVARRNMFELGVIALKTAVAAGYFEDGDWEFVGMGEAFHPVELGNGYTLECAPWLGMEGYAAQMRSSDVLLSLMYAPHPSYPPLEMAACGGITVTNTYGVKTSERLRRVSDSILAVDPVPELVAGAIGEAVCRANAKDLRREISDGLLAPQTWDESFTEAIRRVSGFWRAHLDARNLGK